MVHPYLHKGIAVIHELQKRQGLSPGHKRPWESQGRVCIAGSLVTVHGKHIVPTELDAGLLCPLIAPRDSRTAYFTRSIRLSRAAALVVKDTASSSGLGSSG